MTSQNGSSTPFPASAEHSNDAQPARFAALATSYLLTCRFSDKSNLLPTSATGRVVVLSDEAPAPADPLAALTTSSRDFARWNDWMLSREKTTMTPSASSIAS